MLYRNSMQNTGCKNAMFRITGERISGSGLPDIRPFLISGFGLISKTGFQNIPIENAAIHYSI